MQPNEERFARFCFAIDKVAKNLQKYKNEHLEKFGLRSMHLMYLVSLGHTPEGMTATELAQSCSVDKAFISRLTGDLCDAGYVEYKTKKSTKYNNKLILTETGHRIMTEIQKIIDDSVQHIIGDIPETHLTIFYSVLTRIADHLEAVPV
ncbi:MAG: winged helix-turn-helix transcriptional regulator [Ruminococcaceae bacterium]|nr:winged helix-turn-helix transcriptional regulator [Oscillospiraceae bacterium]